MLENPTRIWTQPQQPLTAWCSSVSLSASPLLDASREESSPTSPIRGRTCTCSNLNCCGCYHNDSCGWRQTNKITVFCDCEDVDPTNSLKLNSDLLAIYGRASCTCKLSYICDTVSLLACHSYKNQLQPKSAFNHPANTINLNHLGWLVSQLGWCSSSPKSGTNPGSRYDVGIVSSVFVARHKSTVARIQASTLVRPHLRSYHDLGRPYLHTGCLQVWV